MFNVNNTGTRMRTFLVFLQLTLSRQMPAGKLLEIFANNVIQVDFRKPNH